MPSRITDYHVTMVVGWVESDYLKRVSMVIGQYA
jgi:hypothetical protein